MPNDAFYKQSTIPELAVPEEEIALPESIGPYKIESLLSRGSMSLLYLGLDSATRTPIAIKVLSPAFVNHPEAVERFLQESKVIALTSHPNIVKLHGQGEWENGLYIAMDFIRGISLKQFIMQQSLSMRRALEIILQVAYAILHLHAHGVIHRDLKPENILITEEGEIKVIDFGIAQLHEETKEASSLGRYLGTPNYMSPEQKENPTKVTFATDIYSLGVILYELILGKLSFGVINLLDLPKGLKKIASKAMAISLQERYLDISDFIHEISQYLNSKELDKDRSESDQVKEIHEKIQKASLNLSPATTPSWPQMDIGIAKGRGSAQLGLYYDLWRLPNNKFLILLASTPEPSLASASAIAVLRGMVRVQVDDFLNSTKNPFRPTPFVEKLNRILVEDPLAEKFALGLLLLDPLQDVVTYISCGFGPLLHVPQGQSKPRPLACNNELLGAALSTEFSETVDNWNTGDILILHTLALPPESPTSDKASLEQALSDSIAENLLLSAQRQSEAILKKFLAIPSLIPYPRAMIGIQRII
ncbi:MAG: protein kinase [Chlamydiota bacterium]